MKIIKKIIIVLLVVVMSFSAFGCTKTETEDLRLPGCFSPKWEDPNETFIWEYVPFHEFFPEPWTNVGHVEWITSRSVTILIPSKSIEKSCEEFQEYMTVLKNAGYVNNSHYTYLHEYYAKNDKGCYVKLTRDWDRTKQIPDYIKFQHGGSDWRYSIDAYFEIYFQIPEDLMPTALPTEVSTKAPTEKPTDTPTEVPTEKPTAEPTEESPIWWDDPNETFVWEYIVLHEMLPEPWTNVGHVDWDNNIGFRIYIPYVSDAEFNEYKNAVIKAGYTINSGSRYCVLYYADNDEGYHVLLDRQTEGYMEIQLSKND